MSSDELVEAIDEHSTSPSIFRALELQFDLKEIGTTAIEQQS